MTTVKTSYIKVNKVDSVVVALENLQQGDQITVDQKTITVKETIPKGHKLALQNIEQGENVLKYGFPIGHSTRVIQEGEWVHTHNVKTNLNDELEYQYQNKPIQFAYQQESKRTFQGYVRKNGSVGIRNEIWIINTVGCINKTAEVIANLANKQFKEEGIDGIYHFPHPFGCSQLGDDLTYTQKILRNLVQHPNAAGVLVLGLGCENNYIDSFKQVLGEYDEERVKFLGVQSVQDEIGDSLQYLEELIQYAQQFKREPVPVSKLTIGLKCGGSDGFSGITANPLVGVYSDMLIAQGGTTILTEVPEMFGAETILMERAKDEETFLKTVDLINDFKRYFKSYDQPVYENPSPGNKEGGITTLEEKSLGCVQKGGFAPVHDVLPYGEMVSGSGLHLLNGPGNDLVSVTALAAAGAQMVLFTTGRGTPYGGPVPTVKIATNTALFERKKNWIDFNAGQLVEGKEMQVLAEEFFDYLIDVASGLKQTNNEKYGFKEIAIFKDGVTL